MRDAHVPLQAGVCVELLPAAIAHSLLLLSVDLCLVPRQLFLIPEIHSTTQKLARASLLLFSCYALMLRRRGKGRMCRGPCGPPHALGYFGPGTIRSAMVPASVARSTARAYAWGQTPLSNAVIKKRQVKRRRSREHTSAYHRADL